MQLFRVKGFLRGCEECSCWTYARVGGRHATNGRERRHRLPNTKFEVYEGISGQTPVAKVMVFLWLLYATIMYLMRITGMIYEAFTIPRYCLMMI